MSYRELKNKNDKEKEIYYTLRLSPTERELLEAKRIKYNYKYLSDYIRDTSIYEDLIVVNVSYADKVLDMFEEYIKATNKLTKEVRRIVRYNLTSDSEAVQQMLYRVYSQTKSLKKAINEQINVELIQKKTKEQIYNSKVKELQSEYNSTQKGEK